MQHVGINAMKKLHMDFNYIRNSKDIAIVKLFGEVDLSNSADFSNFIEKVFANPWKQLVVDLEKLPYMSSTGFGVLAGAILREQEKSNRRVTLCKMHPSLRNIFQILGFESICPIHDSIEEAIREPKNLKIKEVQEKAPPFQVKTQDPVEETSNIEFPIARSCTQCHRTSNFARPGHYRCPYCKSIHKVDDKGILHVISIPENLTKKDEETKIDAEEIEITLPSDMEHLAKLRDFIFSFVDNFFKNQTRTNIMVSLDEACANAIEYGNKFDRTKKIYLKISVYHDKLKLTVKDSGVKTFNPSILSSELDRTKVKDKGRGMGLVLIKQMMDEVQIESTETEGTSICMVKYFDEKSSKYKNANNDVEIQDELEVKKTEQKLELQNTVETKKTLRTHNELEAKKTEQKLELQNAVETKKTLRTQNVTKPSSDSIAPNIANKDVEEDLTPDFDIPSAEECREAENLEINQSSVATTSENLNINQLSIATTSKVNSSKPANLSDINLPSAGQNLPKFDLPTISNLEV